MKIKVCGLKDPENIQAVAWLKPDYMGFICYGPSPRFIAELPIEFVKNLPAETYKTAVFVNESSENINLMIDQYGFDAVQLHGNESPEMCKTLKQKVTLFKAFGLDSEFDFSICQPYEGHVDYFIFDTKTDKHGGSGKTFYWSVLDRYDLNVPFLLSGGIGPDNIDQVIKITHPMFYGVDLNSRFETEPGVKDIDKLKTAFQQLRQTATNEI